jgi:RHS repeat-associated protein
MKTTFRLSFLILAAVAAFAPACLAAGSDPFTVPGSLASQAVFSCGDMTISGGGTIDSAGIAVSGPTNKGTVRSNGKITNSSSTINGDAVPGPGKIVSISGSGVVTGATTAATTSVPCTPINLSTLSTSLASSNNNAAIPATGQGKSVLAGASRTEFSMSGGDTLTLPAGTYYFTKFTISGGSTITLGGAVRILVTGNVSISGGSFVNSNAYSFRFWHSGVTFSLSSSTFTGIVYAPAASLTISSSRLIGSVFADAVTVSGGTSHVTRSIDDVAPSVAITSPPNGGGVSDAAHVLVTGTVSDGQTDVTVMVNGQAATIADNGTWQATLNLSGSPSPATVSAVATDAAGNSAAATVSIVTAAPSISLISPAPGSFINTRTANLSGTAGTATSLTVNGLAATIASGTWTRANFDLGNDGAHTLTIIGTNASGSNTISPVLTNDTTAPTITATVAPSPNAAGWNKSSATVSFTCSDATSGIATCPAAVTVSTETASQTVNGTATDRAGNQKAASIVVKLDTHDPLVAITSPASNTTVTSSSLTVTGSVSDSLSGVAGVTCNGGTAAITGGTFSCGVALNPGDNIITTVATDAAGNTASATRTITYNPDSQLPVIIITSPANNSLTRQATIIVSGTATDDVAVASVSVNGTPATLTNGSWTASITLTAGDGAKTITATAIDTSGKPNSATAQITLDTTPPDVAITSPASGVTVTTSTLSISGTVADATSGVAGVTCNGVAASVTAGSYTCSVTLTVGSNDISVAAVDKAGNTSSAVLKATYAPDTQKPTITITSPPAGTFTKQTAITVSGTASDDVSVASVTVNGAVVPFSNNAWTTTFTLSGNEGPQLITAVATDDSGNSNTAEVTITVDRSAPVVAITSPADHSSGTSASLPVSGSVNDATSGIESVTCNGVNGILGKGTFTCTVPMIAGANTITAVATDKAGNSATTSITATYTPDTQAPVITITAPAAGTFTKVPSITVSGTASDDVAVAKVTVQGVEVPLNNGNWTTTITLTDGDGPKIITAVATDSTLKSTEAHVDLALDTTAPTLVISAPPDHSSGTDSSITVSGTVNDATSGVGPDGVTCNGSSATVAGGTFTCHVTLVPGDNAILVTATDRAGNSTNATTHAVYTPDSQAPVIAITAPADNTFTRNATITVTGTATDDVAVAKVAVNGVDVSFTGGTWTATVTLPAGDGVKAITAVATDTTGKSSHADIQITLDTTAPSITIASPADATTVANPALTINGTVSDAGSGLATLTCNGTAATITNGTFTCSATLVEGNNSIAVIATDKVGNQAASTLAVSLDTRSPELVVSSPAANSCVNGTSIVISGHATDPHLGSVHLSITPGSGSVTVTPNADGTFSETLPLGTDGKYVIAVEASDAAGHTAVATIPLTVDRTAPSIEITSGGAIFTGGAFNHPITINVRGIDADPAPVITATLGGAPFVSGTQVAAEGSYTLNVSAHDCAGNAKNSSVIFRIDTTGPHFSAVAPAAGSTVTTAATAVTGTFDADDVTTVAVEATPVTGTISGRNFSINPIFAEGANSLVLVATDSAGNSTRFSYSLNLKTTTPTVQILESGLPFAPNAVYNRNVTPVIRANETSATVTATLDNAPFSSGTEVSAEITHTIAAHAADAFGHSSDATATFTIDKTPPLLTLAAPADNAVINAASVDVRGSATGGAVKVTVNGIAATLAADGAFTMTLPLDLGANVIVVNAVDAAGNGASVTREVTRDDNRPGLVLTTPGNGMVTNHATISVAGQVLTPTFGAHVTINTTDVTPDANGAFRIDGFALHDGDNAITAAIVGNTRSSVTVHVTSDIVPPVLNVLANGTELQPSARFATSPAIVVQASDNNPAGLTTTLTIDGIVITGAVPTLADGGHVLVAIATDAAHNQTRIDRAFSVGSTSTAAEGCTLNAFDPANNAAVFSNAITFSGHSGGAAAVLVNGSLATIGSGSFSISLPLNNEGANTVTVACANANGTATTDAPATLTIYRYTHAPSIAITSPVNDQILTTTTVTVTGTVGADVVSGDVNGIPFTPSNGAFSVPNVSLASGLNIVTAHGRNAAAQAGIATVHVVVTNGAPVITITSPIPSTQTSASTIDVSGTYTNVDRSTLTAAGVTASTTPTSDTTGNFLATVPLAVGTTTIAVTGRNGAGVQTTATVDVTRAAGPSITITAPADNTFYPANATAPAAITGTISAVDGSTVSVNGVAATVTGNQFTATIGFQAGASGTTPVVARVTTPDGASALDSIRLLKMPAGLTVTRSFPDANATSVDAGALVVVLFSNPLMGSTAAGAVTLADDAGHAVTGRIFVDKDAISFASTVPFDAGRRYTFTVSQSLKDLAGQSLAAPFTLNFTIATTAPGTAPIVTDAGSQSGCLTSATIKGTASAAGARLRLTVDSLTTTAIAGFDKSFTFTVGLSGQPGFHIARIREVGTDGTLSPETDVTYQINCATSTGPTVTAAALDRTAKTLTIQFSKAMNPATLTASPSGTIQLGALAGTVATNAASTIATVTYSGDVSGALTLTVTTGATDSSGSPLASAYSQSFPVAGQTLGNGYITGAIYDASNGRPLQGASVVITPAANGTTTTDDHGRYSTPSLGEGAFTIEASAAGFTKVWRQVVVPSGSGVVPIDIRLTSRGTEQNSGADRTLTHGGDTAVTKSTELFVPSAALASGHKIALTAVGGQSLAGLLPLGWSPLASAEIAVDGSSIPQAIPSSRLTFTLTPADAAAIAAGTQTLSLVQYDNVRDEWRTVIAAAAISANRVATDVQTSGNYALVYPDKGANLAAPATPHAGAALQGVANPCGVTPDVCSVTRKSFLIDPPAVPPNGRATATLITEGTNKAYPSGTAVQAYIDEQLNLADGTVSNSAPFATDLLLYRSPAADVAGAVFHVGPSSDAAKATLRDGVDHIRVVDYPGRIDRGALIGSEGGRVPGDDTISIDIPSGATADPLHASVVPMTAADLHDFQAAGAIPGFHVAAGFTFTVTRADANTATVDLDGDGKPDVIPAILLKPAKGTFTIDLAKFTTANRQVLIAELIDKSAYGSMVRLAATTVAATTPAANVKIVTTEDVNPALLPVDGIVRDGRYLVLLADAPVAYAWGQVHLGSATGSTLSGALVTSANGNAFTAPFGVRDLTRAGGIFAIPVVAQPASTFALKPRGGAIGDGDAATAAAPAPDAKVPFGPLVLAPQPLHLTGITPNNAEVAVDQFHGVATFNLPIDQSSVTGSIVVTNLTTNSIVAGTVAGDGGVHVTFTPSQPLAYGSRFSLVVNPAIRSAAGASLGIAGSASFTTPALPPANATFDRTKIQITIPQNGIATIRGTAGALPAGDVAIAIRRNQFFIEQYQTEVTASDGSFSFTIGKSVGADRVTIADHIDLQVQDKVSRSIVAVFPLTPFVTADGLGFVAPTDQSVTFTSAPPLSVSVTVPLGAFDVPTIITVAAAPKAAFAAVPSFDSELGFYGGVTLNFEGTAKKPLELEQAVPPGTDTTGKTFLLGRLGDSSRGPRVEIDDLVTVVNGKFTTKANGTSSSQRVTKALSVHSQNTLVGGDVKTYLMRTIESGKYAVLDIRLPSGSSVGFAAFDGLQKNLDIFMDLYNSLFVSQTYITAGHGRVVVPIISGKAFTVQGVESATGIQVFERAYDAPVPAAPGQFVGLGSPSGNASGPYPVFGDPFNVQQANVISGVAQITSIPGMTIDTAFATSTDQGTATVSFANVTASPDPPRHLSVYNVRSGDFQEASPGAPSIPIKANVGDALVVYTQSERIEARADMSIVFNEAIDVGIDLETSTQTQIDDAMRKLFTLEKNMADPASGAAQFQPLDAQTTFQLDSGNRRVLIHTDLQAGAEYRVVLDPSIMDTDSAPLALMHSSTGGVSAKRYLYFAVRDPKGKVAQFDLKTGNVHDLALDGNLLLVSAESGGLYAFDASDPANLGTSSNKFARGISLGDSWSISVDNHGRIWTTALTSTFGVVRTYRTETMIDNLSTDPNHAPVNAFGGGTVSWRPGVTTGIDYGLSTTLNSDRPEAIPRKMQIVTQDDTFDVTGGADFNAKFAANTLNANSSPPGQVYDDFVEYAITVPSTGSFPYLTQRITVRNVTAGLRWSDDASSGRTTGSSSAQFNHVLVRSGDHIRVERNVRTYGVISLFGYGIGVYDLNAIESNSLAAQGQAPPTYKLLGTLVDLTDGQGTMTYTPDALAFADNATLTALACAPAKGVAAFATQPTGGAEANAPVPPYSAAAKSSPGYIIPLVESDDTLKAIRARVTNNDPSKPFMGRFNSIARYDVDGSDGIHHRYALVSGGMYGIVVLDATSNPAAPTVVDVIWVPKGAWAVRYIGDSYATSLDGAGHTLLINLSRLDESALAKVKACSTCPAVFPTLAASLAAGGTSQNFGTDDPRIVWRGKTDAANTTLAAVGDVDTGFLFGGTLLTATLRIESAIDPRLVVKARLAAGMTTIGSVVPLGIQPDPGAVDPSDPNASLAAFRVETSLPAGVPPLAIAVESQPVAGVAGEQAPAPLPKSQLRQSSSTGTIDTRPTTVTLRRLLNPALLASTPSLKLQRGANRMVSPWIVAIADPRAASDYTWNVSAATKADLGCASCDRPAFLKNAALGTDYYEIYTLGNFIGIRPDTSAFSSTVYGWLGQNHRLETRVATIPADVVRPSDGASDLDKVAARDLPPAGTTNESVVALNTAEVVTGATDLAIKGRGIDFVLQRNYSSAITNVGPFGRNFDSPLFARVHKLPNHDIVYYDGTGRRDVFTGGTTPPKGVFVQMTVSSDGLVVVSYPDNTRLYFDGLGRLSSITDRNLTKSDGSDGNTMRFVYGGQGQLIAVVDPTGRAVTFDYYRTTTGEGFDGCVHTVTDFDNRVVTYKYDSSGRLTNVSGPDPESPNSAKPSTTYTWGSAAIVGNKQQLYKSGQMADEKDGLNRPVWSADYDSSNPWAAKTLTSGGGSWTITPSADKTTVLDPNNHSWEYGRDADRHINSLKEPGGPTTTYGYDNDGRLASVTRPLGDKTTYGYDSAAGNDRRPMLNVKTATEYPRAGSDEAMAGMTRVTTIGYGPANLPVSIATPDGANTLIPRDPRGNPRSITDAANVTTTPVYDEHGLLKSSSDPRTGNVIYGYLPGSQSGYLNTITTSAGTVTYKSDTRGNIEQIIDPSNRTVTYTLNKLGQVEIESKGDESTRMSYDATGELITKKVLVGVDASGQPIFRQMTFDVDEVGRLHHRTDDAQTTTIGYDPKGNIASFTRTGKPPATFGYDARDRFTTEIVGTQTTTYGYDDNSALASLTNARNKKTIYAQSGFGDSRGTTNAISVTTAQTTDAAGRPVDTKLLKKTADGKTLVLRWSKQEFDPLGRVTRQIRKLFTSPLELPTNGTDPSGATDVISRTIYDDAARKVTVIDPRGNATVSEMDELGRLLRVTDAIGNTLEYEYDANNNKHSETMSEVAPDGKKEATRVVYDYDEQNRVVARTDVTNPATPLDTRFGYDQQGNMTSQTDPDGHTTRFEYDLRRRMTKKTDAMGGVTKYVYDDADRIQSVTDANQNQTTFTYDTDGNLLTERRADGATWSYTYDENFNRKTVTDPNGTVVTFIYDDADRLVEKQIAKGTNVAGPSRVTVTLDDLDRTVATTTDEGVAETFAFDSLDRPLNESLQISTGPKRTFVRAFDPAGNVIGLTYPSGLQLTYDIDKIDRIAAIRDAASPATPIVAYTDIGGRPSTKTFANGVTETWKYDPNRRLAEILSKVPNATLRDVQYERSRAGDKLSAIRPDLGKKSVFTYNANHWMTNESTGVPLTGINPQPALSVDYDIDPVLNMHSIARSINATSGTTSTATSFSINNRNQYTAAGTEPLSYDRNGNLTSRTGLVMQYDHENHLRKATLTGGATIENVYDVSGRKVEQKVADGGTTHITDYALSGEQANEEYVDGTLANRYVHGRELDEIVRANVGSTIVYPLQDEQANVERITDTDGAVVERYEYQEYGKFSVFGSDGSPRSSPTWRHLFQGRDYDAALNVYDFRARTLWPDIARFGQEDPAKIGANLSLYQAFRGSPLNLTDPSGLYEEDVHHYLTRYLANAVGYDGAASESIGYETGHLDFDERDAMYGGRNVKSWELYHFVSKERLDHMQSDVLTLASENDRQIGEYLHALEDSYSHQSNPDRREWGARFLLQSVAGHGAKGHDPDQTWRRPALAMLMAQDVYGELQHICGHFGSRCGQQLPFEGRVRTRIAAFIAYRPELFLERIDGLDVETVRDYTAKVKLLDRVYEIAPFEREPREKAYREVFERLHVHNTTRTTAKLPTQWQQPPQE